jgi:uncharacterized protein (TIGR02598 family)
MFRSAPGKGHPTEVDRGVHSLFIISSAPSRLHEGCNSHNTFQTLMKPTRSNSASQERQAFSLIELAAALAILAVGVVGLMALMPSGMTQARKAADVTVTAQIAQRLLAEAEQSEFDELIDRTALPPDPKKRSYCPERFSFRAPKVAEPAFRYFDDQGKEIVPRNPGKLSDTEKASVIYYASMRIRPRAELPMVNETSAHVAQVTLQLVRNPAHKTLEIETDKELPSWNMLKAENGYTFSAVVGRKQGR